MAALNMTMHVHGDRVHMAHGAAPGKIRGVGGVQRPILSREKYYENGLNEFLIGFVFYGDPSSPLSWRLAGVLLAIPSGIPYKYGLNRMSVSIKSAMKVGE
jgi:hypothetical protein